MKIDGVQRYLIAAAIGVRFRPNFSLEDKLGTVVDEILYSDASFFDPKFFPNHQAGINERVLLNEETGNTLLLSPSNIILDYNLPNSGDTESLERVINAFQDQIVKGIMKKYEVTQIGRLGAVLRYVFQIPELAKSFIEQSIGKTLEGVNNINLRFSKRYPVEEALVKKDINDYANVILNVIKRADKEELFISVDYQWYFVPLLDKVEQMKFEEFVERTTRYNRESFPEWVSTNYGLKR